MRENLSNYDKYSLLTNQYITAKNLSKVLDVSYNTLSNILKIKGVKQEKFSKYYCTNIVRKKLIDEDTLQMWRNDYIEIEAKRMELH